MNQWLTLAIQREVRAFSYPYDTTVIQESVIADLIYDQSLIPDRVSSNKERKCINLISHRLDCSVMLLMNSGVLEFAFSTCSRKSTW
uniref:Uncharacterized protein n=1 Tax=Utricularia reniformis TaxID=192314 RepID=A0A1Y0B1T8_9LAMI|nr:hypothetical protein AEK19_MT1099 [Utricularia reniformis]ART31319.1 hypothetical protein AEK19_MT1099 [Utricularia reniformis]